MATSSVEGAQGGLVIVQRNVLTPNPSPLTADVGEPGVVIVPVPLTNVQVPVPTVGVLPAKVVLLAVIQSVWSGPAVATVGSALILIVTSSDKLAHAPPLMVQRNTLAPTARPVTPEVGDEGVVIVPLPLTKLQLPVPEVGVLPAKVVVVTLHNDWSGPASAVEGVALTFIVTSSVVEAQGGLLTVQRNTFAPGSKPVTPEVGELGDVTVPEPLTNVQVPVPVVGVLPANVTLVLQILWSGPALAAVGRPFIVIVTSFVDEVQGELLMVQRNTLSPTAKPVTPEVGEEGVVTVPLPLTSVQVPVPEVGVLPAKVAVVTLHNV